MTYRPGALAGVAAATLAAFACGSEPAPDDPPSGPSHVAETPPIAPPEGGGPSSAGAAEPGVEPGADGGDGGGDVEAPDGGGELEGGVDAGTPIELGTWNASGNCAASVLDYSSCHKSQPGCDPVTQCATSSYGLPPWTSTLTLAVTDGGARVDVASITSSSGFWTAIA
jgi:hypothetical protein